jgi:hypothetical protein
MQSIMNLFPATAAHFVVATTTVVVGGGTTAAVGTTRGVWMR